MIYFCRPGEVKNFATHAKMKFKPIFSLSMVKWHLVISVKQANLAIEFTHIDPFQVARRKKEIQISIK
jgi:hypothetical protein